MFVPAREVFTPTKRGIKGHSQMDQRTILVSRRFGEALAPVHHAIDLRPNEPFAYAAKSAIRRELPTRPTIRPMREPRPSRERGSS